MELLLSISEFAKLSGITRVNLIFYDKEEILVPVERKENNYRVYSYHQLELAYVITSLRNMEVSLRDIKSYIRNRTPQVAEELFIEQMEKVEDKIDKLIQMKDMLHLYIQNIREFRNMNIPILEVRELEEEVICFGPVSNMKQGISSIVEFIQLCRENKIHYVNHIGKYFSEEKINNKDWSEPDNFYIKSKKGGFQKERGLYLVLIERIDGRDKSELYRKMISYLEENNLTICGNTYEEYILDELSVKNSNDYVVKITMQVVEGFL